jgi:putative ABC transport system permease protein
MVVRGIGRNRRRTVSTALGVVLALVLILVSWGMVDTAQILVDRQFSDVDRQDAQLYYSGPIGSDALEAVRQTNGVERVEPSIDAPVSLTREGARYQTSLIGLERDTQMHGFLLAGGGTTTLPEDGVLVGQALGSELDVVEGEEIRIEATGEALSAWAPVRGFLEEPLGTFVYAALPAIRSLAGTSIGKGNVALVRYEPGVDRQEMRNRLSSLPGVVAFEDTNALLDTVNQYLGLYYAFVGMMLVFGGAMAFALLFNAMSSNIAERSVEVATMRASGASFRTLARMITAENVIVTVIGIAPGLVAGYLVAAAFMASFSSDQFSFALQMRTSTLVLSALAILGVSLLSQWPGLRAVRRLDVARVVRERAA